MLGGMFIKGALKRVKARMDDSEYGGAVLLGLGGIVVVAHGKSKANAIRNAIRVAKQGVESDVPGKIEAAVAQDKVHAPLVAAVA
jgi:glycerol-3-phosphate acyltransferase PlsX